MRYNGQISTPPHHMLVIVPLYIIIFAFVRQVDWSLLQWAVALVLAVDVRSGFVTNHLYRLAGLSNQPWSGAHLTKWNGKWSMPPFLHLQVFLAALTFDHSLVWALGWYLALNVSVLIVERVPRDRQKWTSLAMTIIAIAINVVFFRPPVLLEWIIPLLFVHNVFRTAPVANSINSGEKVPI